MRSPRRAWGLGIATLVLISVLAAPSLGATLNHSAGVDAFVIRNQATSNKGAARQLKFRNDVKRAYFRFDVALPAGETIESATLRVFATSAPRCPQGAEVLRAASDTWGESTITWSNQPGPAASLDTTSSWTANSYVSFDVSPAVTGSGEVSFVLRHAPGCSASGDATFQSREAANDPQLVVETSSETVPQCSDGQDNDSDGATDFPADPGCTSAGDQDETDAPPPSEAVIAAAGDIACAPDDTASPCHHRETSDLILADPTITDVLVLGDNQYDAATLSNYQASYDPTWGRFKAITHPSVGNHEYEVPNAQGYRDYFGLGSGPLWYSFDLGDWHIVALDSNCTEIGGCSTASAQAQFLRNDLQSDNHRCELVYWHHPYRLNSAPAASPVGPFWQIAYDNGVDVILSGHAHNYERFSVQTPAGAVDSVSGIRQFVVGTGGRNHSAASPHRNSQVFDDSTFGVLKMALGASNYAWEFVPDTTSGSFTDSGTTACH